MSTLADIYSVQTEDIDQIWPEAAPFIKKAVERNEKFEPEDIKQLLLDRKAQLWVVVDNKQFIAAIITSIEHSATKKWVRVMWAGGSEIDKWLYAMDVIENWARSIGCHRSMVIGRNGWLKKLNGYSKTAVILEKAL